MEEKELSVSSAVETGSTSVQPQHPRLPLAALKFSGDDNSMMDGDEDDEISQTSMSVDLCDPEDRHRNRRACNSSSSAPCQTVHFETTTAEKESSSSSLSRRGYYIPLEKVGKNYRSLRRRGAAVHSQLLKNAFEASMSSYDTDEDDDDYSMYASNSTLASRDGVEEAATVPRKRLRNNNNDNDASSTADDSASIGHLFGDMVLKNSPRLHNKPRAVHRGSATSISSSEGNFPIQHFVLGSHQDDHQSVQSCDG